MSETRAVDILVAAFQDDPVSCWLVPDERGRPEVAACLFRPLVQQAVSTGGLVIVDDAAVAVWVTMGAGEEPFGGNDDELPDVLRPHADRLATFAEWLGPRHPSGRRHLYLPFIGVLPGRRGSGLGSALLKARLTDADADGMPAYLEASPPRGRSLYERHGFRPTGEPVVLPDGPPILPMWREPGETTTESEKENTDDH